METRKQLLEDADVLSRYEYDVARGSYRDNSILSSIAGRLRTLAEDAPEDAPARCGLVPIKTDGPWMCGGKAWERWHSGRFDCSSAEYRVHNGVLECRSATDVLWFTPGGPGIDDLELRSPRGWQPTPPTIPEGCFIPTPKGGMDRCCASCLWDSRVCPDECVAADPDLGDPLGWPKWCPLPSKKPEHPFAPPISANVNSVWRIFETLAQHGCTPDHGHGDVAALALGELSDHLRDHMRKPHGEFLKRVEQHQALLTALVARKRS